MPLFVVNSQVRRTDIDPNTGTVSDGYLIRFTDNETKVQGSLFVPDGLYDDADRVGAMILAEIGKIRAVHALGAD